MPGEKNPMEGEATSPSSPQRSISALAMHGVLWSVVQNWGGRLFTFLLFIVLARILTPTEFGQASAALIVLMLISLVAEFGFGDAIVQRRDLRDDDVNLPFYVSVAVSICLTVTSILSADRIETWLGAPGLAPIVIALVGVAPLTTISLFQEVNYRRHLAFRTLALRVLASNLVAGIAAIGCALVGGGVWSLVAQSYVATLVGLVWLWRRPIWMPGRALHPTSFAALMRFGSAVATMRLVDFAATRFFEVMLIARYGMASYGLYAAGAKLYQTLMQLLQSALNDVSLTVLSKISDDRERVARIYLQTITLAAMIFAPIFVACAAVSPEISSVLFGARWDGIDAVARPLLLLGAVQSVQFLNGPYLASRGRPGLLAGTALIKSAGIVAVTLSLATDNMAGFVYMFIFAQLLATPLSFGFVLIELRISLITLVLRMVPPIVGCAAADFIVGRLRTSMVSLR